MCEKRQNRDNTSQPYVIHFVDTSDKNVGVDLVSVAILFPYKCWYALSSILQNAPRTIVNQNAKLS